MWEKEKMLVTSIFFFSHNASIFPETYSIFLVTFILSSARSLNLDWSKILVNHELWANRWDEILLHGSWKMLLSEPLVRLITFSRTSFIKYYLNSHRMSDFFYHITESSELNKGIKVQNIFIWPCLWIFAQIDSLDVNIRTVRSMTSWNLIAHVCETRKIAMAILHGKPRGFMWWISFH